MFGKGSSTKTVGLQSTPKEGKRKTFPLPLSQSRPVRVSRDLDQGVKKSKGFVQKRHTQKKASENKPAQHEWVQRKHTALCRTHVQLHIHTYTPIFCGRRLYSAQIVACKYRYEGITGICCQEISKSYTKRSAVLLRPGKQGHPSRQNNM